MLADQPKDAINVCLRQLGDWQLAVALARAVEPEANGPLLKWVLTDTVIPLAFEGGHRWLASWAFWTIGRRDLSVRVLIVSQTARKQMRSLADLLKSPLATVASAWSPTAQIPVGLSENDDPSLLLLFQYLKSKSLQTAKGTNEIPSKLEFDFVLHNARVFFRMGKQTRLNRPSTEESRKLMGGQAVMRSLWTCSVTGHSRDRSSPSPPPQVRRPNARNTRRFINVAHHSCLTVTVGEKVWSWTWISLLIHHLSLDLSRHLWSTVMERLKRKPRCRKNKLHPLMRRYKRGSSLR